MSRNKADGTATGDTRNDAESGLAKMALLDPASAISEEEGGGQFVTALARGLELMRCFSPRDNVLAIKTWRE